MKTAATETRDDRCKACDGLGQTSARTALATMVDLLLLAGSDSILLDKRIHPWLRPHLGTLMGRDLEDLHLVSTGLAGRAPLGPFGHDAIDCLVATRAVIKAAGLDPETWGLCPDCKGEGTCPA